MPSRRAKYAVALLLLTAFWHAGSNAQTVTIKVGESADLHQVYWVSS